MRIIAVVAFLFNTISISICVQGQDQIFINTKERGAIVSKDLHGIFFEEISHAGEGGLYPELIQNRGFEESKIPEGCTLDSGWIIPPKTSHFGAKHVVDWKMRWEPVNPHPAWSLQTDGKSKAKMAIDLAKPLQDETPRSLRIEISNANL